jgi:5-methylcytosine-specific restriction endonuclease McrA
MLQRPIYGGIFGRGVYALATQPTITNGLHAVKFMVVDPRAGTVLSVSDVKLEAIAMARRLLHLTTPAANDARWQQAAFWPNLPVEPVPKVRPISRRRRQVFERSGGRCHYCRSVLTLDGRWHVEHMVPRALGGGEAAANLVAACAPCNLAKGDRTALEFVSAAAAAGARERRSRSHRTPPK